jgi:uncharacterized protein
MTELTPWRKVVKPQKDVAQGKYVAAEFAADLSSVISGKASKEYADPKEFFKRTHITKGIVRLVDMAMLRMTGKGGQPILQLKTVFGGGKTHTMLALYHLLNGIKKVDSSVLTAFDPSWQGSPPKKANIAVLVGTALNPTKATEVAGHPGLMARTLWGHLAGQLGGTDGYAMVEESDSKGIPPGSDTLLDVFNRFSPCCIIIDEAVAYVRGLYEQGTASGGNWDGNTTFFQQWTEATSKCETAIGVISIPESDVEIGGVAGQKTKDAIEHVVKRQDDIGIPLDTDEGFEIVKRRLFDMNIDEDLRETTVIAFHKMYQDESQVFPKNASDAEYFERLRSCYPIHPEVFDQLYGTWSQLERFQRTRGVLRLMAKVISTLWQGNDNSPMILPGTIPLFEKEVAGEFTRNLPEDAVWDPIITTEIDGNKSISHVIDGTNPLYGQTQMARRVARTLFIGTAPRVQSKARGLEKSSILLGSLEPGVPVSRPTDALSHITNRSANLYEDGRRFWYDTQKNLKREAEERARAIEDFRVRDLIMKLLIKDSQKGRAELEKVHISDKPEEILDEMSQRLVILPPDTLWSDKGDQGWKDAVTRILDSKGGGNRLYRNTLAFVICDSTRWNDLNQATRLHLAWEHIFQNHEIFNLDAYKRKEAKRMVSESLTILITRLSDAYKTLIIPIQNDPTGDVEFEFRRLPSDSIQSIAIKASQQMVSDEYLIPKYSPKLLSDDLNKWFLDKDDHIDLKRACEVFFQFTYFPRLKNRKTFEESVCSGVSSGDFGHAREFVDGKYENPRIDEEIGSLQMDGHAVIISKTMAETVVEAAIEVAGKAAEDSLPKGDIVISDVGKVEESDSNDLSKGTGLKTPISGDTITQTIIDANVDPVRSRAQFDELTEHIVKHLTKDPKSTTKIRVTIESDNLDGFDEKTIRTIKENASNISSIDQDPEFH